MKSPCIPLCERGIDDAKVCAPSPALVGWVERSGTHHLVGRMVAWKEVAMAKKDGRKRKKTGKTWVGPTGPMDGLAVRRSMERNMEAISKLIEEHKFESREELDKYLQSLAASGDLDRVLGRSRQQDPLTRAQHIAFDAWETANLEERIGLAHKALEVSPDCADAYVILAEESARGLGEALVLYQAGVEAGERALGAKAFSEDVGHFWAILSTRPYMRARTGLAQTLSAIGRHKEAAEHYRDLLRLNPNDNQGNRHLLAACLLEMGDVDALLGLLGQYDEPTAAWLYTSAVATFIKKGDGPEARRLLLKAVKQNRYVVPYLLGDKMLPRELPDYVGFGDETEAVWYVEEFAVGWLAAKGAINWLGSVWRSRQTRPEGRPKATDVPEVFLRAFEPEAEAPQPAGKNLADIYTFKVSLKAAPGVWRKIELKGSQTLHHLHRAIFKAFERWEEHLYAFYLSNKPGDVSSEYGLHDPESRAKSAKQARVGSLGLKANKEFLYLFDFGDSWWHSVQLLGIKHEEERGRYPRIVESQGEAPPQYGAYEEDEDGP